MIIAVFTFNLNAQDGKLSTVINVGLPIGNTSNISSFSIAADVNYGLSSSDEFDWGITVGFIHYFGKTLNNISLGDITFLPIAGTARFNASNEFIVGADIGYALGISSGNNGGFYYRPLVGYKLSDTIQINASYQVVSNTGSISNFGVGLQFGL
ncbi:hypothetical protein OD91_0081 [Lutibacter sp. Hel_I_33_5]|nr:hypothetical protein OD91_0081 [Lutibacter sp. Hel_I_33_5]